MGQRILLVEDEAHLRDVIRLNLDLEGYDVTSVNNGKSALEEVEGKRFDLVLLDIMLPEIDGFKVCESIRLRNMKVPILIVSAKGGSQDKIQGLKLGADDYLAKPFNLEELLLRVKNLLKRADPIGASSQVEQYQFGNNVVDFSSYQIMTSKGLKKLLSKKEIMLLRLLIDRRNSVVSREQILESVWGYDVYPSTRTIDNYILAFRKYFEENPKSPKYFISIRGIGYKFSNGSGD
ncbi:MAG TPA: response regulator transcription factor [Flavobacteriales bacterium]|nr:response regulator transcription factor [Flavobacteriales bacterium]